METITHKRPVDITDEYDNTVGGTLETVGTLQALIAPQMVGDTVLVGRSPIETNYNVYIPDQTGTGVGPDDVLTIRGQDVPVDGRIAEWPTFDGGQAGTHIQVRLVTG